MLRGTPAPAWRRSMSATVPPGGPKNWMFVVASIRVGVCAGCGFGDEVHVEDH